MAGRPRRETAFEVAYNYDDHKDYPPSLEITETRTITCHCCTLLQGVIDCYCLCDGCLNGQCWLCDVHVEEMLEARLEQPYHQCKLIRCLDCPGVTHIHRVGILCPTNPHNSPIFSEERRMWRGGFNDNRGAHAYNGNEVCVICMEEMQEPFDTLCEHKFHLSCIQLYIRNHVAVEGGSAPCPVCREPIAPMAVGVLESEIDMTRNRRRNQQVIAQSVPPPDAPPAQANSEIVIAAPLRRFVASVRESIMSPGLTVEKFFKMLNIEDPPFEKMEPDWSLGIHPWKRHEVQGYLTERGGTDHLSTPTLTTYFGTIKIDHPIDILYTFGPFVIIKLSSPLQTMVPCPNELTKIKSILDGMVDSVVADGIDWLSNQSLHLRARALCTQYGVQVNPHTNKAILDYFCSDDFACLVEGRAIQFSLNRESRKAAQDASLEAFNEVITFRTALERALLYFTLPHMWLLVLVVSMWAEICRGLTMPVLNWLIPVWGFVYVLGSVTLYWQRWYLPSYTKPLHYVVVEKLRPRIENLNHPNYGKPVYASLLSSCAKKVPLPPQRRSAYTVCKTWDDPCDRKQKEYQLFGTTIEGAPMVVPSTCQHNCYSSLRQRMTFLLPKNVVGYKKMRDHMKILLSSFCFPTLVPAGCYVKKMSDFIKAYSGRRKQQLEKALKDVKEGKEPHKWWVSDCFIKIENYLGKFGDAMDMPNFKPRCIQARKDFILLIKGPLMLAFGKLVRYGIMTMSNGFVYTSGVDAHQLGDFAEELFHRFPIVFDSDVSNWDGSMTKDDRDIELDLVTWLSTYVLDWGDHPRDLLFKYFFTPLSKLVYFDFRGVVKGKVEGVRRSGDPETSVWNSMLNWLLSSMVAEYPKYALKMAIQGDDNFGGTDNPNFSKQRATATYKALGRKCVVNIRKNIEELEFCSGRFWPVKKPGGRVGYKWGVMPFRVLSKTFFNYHLHNERILPRLAYGTAVSMLPIAGHVPLIGAYLRGIIFRSKVKKLKMIKPKDFKHKVSSSSVDEPCPETYEHFCRVYGYTVKQVKEMEEYLFHCDGPVLLSRELFGPGLAVDIGVPMDKWQPDNSLKILGDRVEEKPVVHVENNLDFWLNVVATPIFEEFIRGIDVVYPIYYIIEVLLSGPCMAAGFNFVMWRLNFLPYLFRVFIHALYNASVFYLSVSPGSMLHWLKTFSPTSCSFRMSKNFGFLSVQKKKQKQQPAKSGGRKNPKKSKNRGNRRTRPPGNGGNARQYMKALMLPFHPDSIGCRVPDEFTYPSVAFPLKESGTFSTNSGGYWSAAFQPFLQDWRYDPANTTGGTITWAGGSASSMTQSSAFSSQFDTFRSVAWGIRITLEYLPLSTTGHMWVGHVPYNSASQRYAYDRFPTSESQIAQSPYFQKYALSELVKPLIVPGRYIDSGCERFRDAGAPSATATSGVENLYGFSSIIVYVAGAPASVSLANIEYVNHVECTYKATATLQVGMCNSPSDLLGLQNAKQAASHAPISYIETPQMELEPERFVAKLVNTASKVASASSKADKWVKFASRIGAYALGGYRDPGGNNPLIGLNGRDGYEFV